MTQQRGEQHDSAEFERVERALRAAFDSSPGTDRGVMWARIESRLGEQHVPWHVTLRRNFGSLFHAPMRQVALAGTAVLVVGALVLSGVFESGNQASAAVLDQVNELSTAADAALADGVLSPQEIADLHERAVALLAEIESDPNALTTLTPDELKLVIQLLTVVGDDLHAFANEDHGEHANDFNEAVRSITESTTRAEDFRRERGDDGHERETQDGGSGGVLGTADALETPEADDTPEATSTAAAAATAEATETPEATATPESKGTPEAEGTPEPEGTPEAEDTPEAQGTPEASGGTTTSIDAVAGTYTYPAGTAGNVTFSFDGSRLEVDSFGAAAGWTASVLEGSGEEIAVRFTSGDQQVTFKVARGEGTLRISTTDGSGSSEQHDD